MGGGKGGAPDPPDYSQIAAASEKAAELSYELGKEQLAWAKETYASDKLVTDRVVESFLETMDLQNDAAAKDRARYEEVYQPLEDDLIADARSYASDERRALEIGKAQASVSQQFDSARESAQRELEAFGINPSATRYAALDIGVRTQQAAAAAAAGNQASNMVDATGRALRSEAINVGRGYPGQVAGTYNTALQSGSGAISGTLNQTQSGAATMGTNAQYMGLGNQALNTWGNTLNMGYQNSLDQWKANQSQSSGWGQALGLIGGMGMKAFGFADGGLVEEGHVEGALPLEGEPAGQGAPVGAIPAAASPTGGRAVDDVPAQLSAGEFVVPKDAVRWHGEKHLYGLIEKARREREESKQKTGAIPQLTEPTPAQPPTPAHPPIQAAPAGALPVR